MACGAGVVDLSSGGKYPRGILRLGGPERFLRSSSQAARRGDPLALIPGAGVHREQVRRFDEHRSAVAHGDRKSTRLNSSHLVISYAVFCLKKKKIISDRIHL